MACKSCKNNSSSASAPMAPAGIDPQGFQQAQLYGTQFGQQPKSSFWTGSKGGTSLFPTQTPQQNQLANQAIQSAMGLLGQGNQPDYSGFEPFAQQAKTDFYEDIIPSLAERFTAMGGGAQNSSAFQGQLGKYGSDLAQGLAALRSQYGMQQQGLQNQRLGTLLSGGMQPQFQSAYMPPQPGFLQNLGSGLAGGAGLIGSLGLKSLFGI